MADDKRTNRLDALNAAIDILRGDSAQAQRRLENNSDEFSERRRLMIMVESNQVDALILRLRTTGVDESHLDLAAAAFASVGDFGAAQACVQRAQQSVRPGLAHRTAMQYMHGTLCHVFTGRAAGDPLTTLNTTEAEKIELLRLLQPVEALCESSVRRGRVETVAEAMMLEYYFDVFMLASDINKCEQIVLALRSYKPLRMKVGEAALRGIGLTADAIERLRAENPADFDALLMACRLEYEHQPGERAAIIDRVFGIAPLAQTAREKEQLCSALQGMSVSTEERARLVAFISTFLPKDSTTHRFIKADLLTQAGRHAESRELLETIRDERDPRWLQLYGSSHLAAGNSVQALNYYRQLSLIAPHATVLQEVASLAARTGAYEEETKALESAVRLDPDNSDIRSRLASSYLRDFDYLRAADQFERILAVHGDSVEVRANLAVCYGYLSQPERAIQTLRSAPSAIQQSLPLLKVHAQILELMGRVSEAYELLWKVQSAYSDNHEYLLALQHFAYASGHDSVASEVMQKLLDLQTRGIIPPDVIQSAPVSSLIERVQKAAKSDRDSRQFYLRGVIPWLTAAEIRHEALYWSWLLRTQPLDWMTDDPLGRAGYVLYSTHGFFVYRDGGHAQLVTFQCPAPNTPIVMDLSALISIHELNLLDPLAKYFGSILIPASYLARGTADLSRLLPHQLSQKMAADYILAAVASRQLTVIEKGDTSSAVQYVSEYDEESPRSHLALRLRDVLQSLHMIDALNDIQLKEAARAAHKPPRLADGAHIESGSSIEVDGLTLSTLVGLGLSDTILRRFHVHMSESDLEEQKARSKAFAALEQARLKHVHLWKSLQEDSRFEFAGTNSISSEDESATGISLDSLALRRSKNVPIFADDRAIQTIVTNELPSGRDFAFGVDAFLTSLLKARPEDSEVVADSFLQLIGWRYRFLLVPQEVLVIIAKRSRSHPPGRDLRLIARYVHECMQDAGLFSGTEPTSTPSTIATSIYQSWVNTIVEFVMTLWRDSTLEERFVTDITRWAMEEFLPSPPRGLAIEAQVNLSTVTNLMVFSRALIASAFFEDFEKAHRALTSIASALGMEKRSYFEYLVQVAQRAK